MSSSKDLLGVSGVPPRLQCVAKTLQKDAPVRMKPIPTQSKALESVKAFLPQLAAANTQLKSEMETKPAESFDIENVEEDDAVVEMNLSLFECDNSSDSDDDSDDDDDDDDDASSGASDADGDSSNVSGNKKELVTEVEMGSQSDTAEEETNS